MVGAAHALSCPHYLHPSTQAGPQDDAHAHPQYQQAPNQLALDLLNMPALPPPFGPTGYRLLDLRRTGRLPPPPLPPAHGAAPSGLQAPTPNFDPQMPPRADLPRYHVLAQGAQRRLSQIDTRMTPSALDTRSFPGPEGEHANNPLSAPSILGRRSSLPEYQRQLAELEAANNRHLSRAQQYQLSLQQPPLPPAQPPNRRRSSGLPGDNEPRHFFDWPRHTHPHGVAQLQAQPEAHAWTLNPHGSPGLDVITFPPPPPLPTTPVAHHWNLSPWQYDRGRYGSAGLDSFFPYLTPQHPNMDLFGMYASGSIMRTQTLQYQLNGVLARPKE